MAWFHLLVAAAFEVAFAMGMKFSNGFGRLWPSLLTVVAAIGGSLPDPGAARVASQRRLSDLDRDRLAGHGVPRRPAAWREPDGGEAGFCRVDRRRGGRAQVSDAAFGLQSAAFPFLREQPC